MALKRTITRRLLVSAFYMYFLNYELEKEPVFLDKYFFDVLKILTKMDKRSSFDFSQEIIDAYKDNHFEINSNIEILANSYRFEKIPPVNRAILSIAMTEMKYLEDKISFKIIVNESIELAKYFTDKSSAKFINGVLATFIKKEVLT